MLVAPTVSFALDPSALLQTDKSQYAHPMDDYFRTLYTNLKSVSAPGRLLSLGFFLQSPSQLSRLTTLHIAHLGRQPLWQGERGRAADRESSIGGRIGQEAGAHRQAHDHVSNAMVWPVQNAANYSQYDPKCIGATCFTALLLHWPYPRSRAL